MKMSSARRMPLTASARRIGSPTVFGESMTNSAAARELKKVF